MNPLSMHDSDIIDKYLFLFNTGIVHWSSTRNVMCKILIKDKGDTNLMGRICGYRIEEIRTDDYPLLI